jgi:hypothetical protein
MNLLIDLDFWLCLLHLFPVSVLSHFQVSTCIIKSFIVHFSVISRRQIMISGTYIAVVTLHWRMLTRVVAGWNTSTMTLRVVGLDKKGSL